MAYEYSRNRVATIGNDVVANTSVTVTKNFCVEVSLTEKI